MPGARPAARAPSISVAAAAGCVVVFVLVMAPWWARQLAVFGSLSPSTASGKVLFIRSIDEWNSITTPATLEHLLGMGIGPLLATRIGGLVAAVRDLRHLVAGSLLVPLMVIGGWARRRSQDFRPFFIYAAILFAFSALVSAVHVPGGTFIHSASRWRRSPTSWPSRGSRSSSPGSPLADRPGTRRVPRRVFSGAVIGFAIFCSGGRHGLRPRGAGTAVATRRWRSPRPSTLPGRPPTDRVMSIDAASTKYWTGRGGVVLVNDPLDTIRDVARAYDIRWLVLDKDDTVPAAAPVMAGDRPAWIGRAVRTPASTA